MRIRVELTDDDLKEITMMYQEQQETLLPPASAVLDNIVVKIENNVVVIECEETLVS